MAPKEVAAVIIPMMPALFLRGVGEDCIPVMTAY
jgi:hypothetical protein